MSNPFNRFDPTNMPSNSYGNMARDTFLEFQLKNDTGNYIKLEQQETKTLLSLYSKSGKLLNSVDLIHELPSRAGMTGKYLYIDPQGNLTWSAVEAITILSNTTEVWNSNPTLVSQKNTIYVYTDHDKIEKGGSILDVPGIKIGDGNAYLIDKPFITATIEEKLTNYIEMLTEHLADVSSHVSASDRSFWDNKLNCIEPTNNELLIFTRG